MHDHHSKDVRKHLKKLTAEDRHRRELIDAAKQMMAISKNKVISPRHANKGPKGPPGPTGPTGPLSQSLHTIGEKWPDGSQMTLRIVTDGTGIFLRDRAGRSIMMSRSEVMELLSHLNKAFILDILGDSGDDS